MSSTGVVYNISDFPKTGQYFVNHEEFTKEHISTFNVEKLAPKLVVIGQPGVGKTCLISRICRDSFDEAYLATIGAQFVRASCTINGVQSALQIWDIAGQESYTSVTKLYFRGTDVAYLCFDMSSKPTLDALENWLRVLRENTGNVGSMFLVGCKSDLKQQVSDEDIKAFAEKNKLEYFATSAKDKANTSELAKRTFFLACVASMEKKRAINTFKYKNTSTTETQAQKEPPQTVDLSKPAQKKPKKGGCCA